MTFQEKEFENIIEQSPAFQNFLNDIQNNTVSHCYLLKCKDDYTRELFAVSFAKKLLERNSTPQQLENVEKRVHPDVHFYMDKNASLKVEDAVEIWENVGLFGVEQDKRIYILDNFENATVQMQNKMLKTFEEPPLNVHFLIMAKDDERILMPIKSRAKKIYIAPLDSKVIDSIVEKYGKTQNAELAKLVGQNYLGKTLNALNSNQTQEIFNVVVDLIQNCKSSKEALKYASQISAMKNSFEEVLEVYSSLLSKALENKCSNTNNGQSEIISEIANKFSLEGIEFLEAKILEYYKQYKSNCNLNLIIDTLVLDNLQARTL